MDRITATTTSDLTFTLEDLGYLLVSYGVRLQTASIVVTNEQLTPFPAIRIRWTVDTEETTHIILQIGERPEFHVHVLEWQCLIARLREKLLECVADAEAHGILTRGTKP